MAESEYLPHLQSLSLERTDIGDEGLKVLAQSSQLRNLKSLGLSWNSWTDEGLEALAEWPL